HDLRHAPRPPRDDRDHRGRGRRREPPRRAEHGAASHAPEPRPRIAAPGGAAGAPKRRRRRRRRGAGAPRHAAPTPGRCPPRTMRGVVRGAALAAATVLVAMNVAATPPPATGREVIAEAQARNGFATWRDRKSVVMLEGFDGANHTTREAEVYERTDPHGEHRELFEYRSPGDFAGTRYLVVSPRHTRQEWWLWTPATRRT